MQYKIKKYICTLMVSLILFHNPVFADALATTEVSNEDIMIRLAVDPDWYPFEKIDKDGTYIGIAADLIALIELRSGVTFEVIQTETWSQSVDLSKSGQSDALAFLNKTPDREKWLVFSDVYFTDYNAIITREEHVYVPDLSRLSNETVVLPVGTSVEEYLKNQYPNLQIITVESEEEAINYVLDKKADLTIRSLTMAAYVISSQGLFNLKIAGQLPDYANQFRIGVIKEKAYVIPYINQGISTLTQQEVQDIINRYIAINIQEGFNYQLFFVALGVFFVIVIGFIYWNRKLSHLNRKLAQRQEELTTLSNQLLKSEEKYKCLADELAIKNEALSQTALHDKLTGLRNRFYFDQKIGEELDRSDRYGSHLSLLFFDLDHFKIVNDTFGHDQGDEVLIKLSEIINKRMRKSDVFARWGGEEFVIMMPHTPLEHAIKAAENIREAIESHVFDIVGRITISIGIAERERYESKEAWFRRVDKALYRAKREGRNRVCAMDFESSKVHIRVEWKDQWLSGNKVIDNQHQNLLELGNDFIEQTLNDPENILVGDQIERLIEHIVEHFRAEEAILDKNNYDALETHKEEHLRLIEKATQLKRKYEAGGMCAADAFDFIVHEVIMEHMLKEDVKFFKVFSKKTR